MRVPQLFAAVAISGALLGEKPTPAIKAPRILERLEPQYTNEARAAGIEGTVTLRAELDESGWLSSFTVFNGLGHGLDENAISCARQWRVEPAMRDGVPIRVRVGLDISFRLSHHP
jgi:TonB family protein